MEIVIFWAFVVALIADVISNDRKMEPKNALQLICQTGLFILTGILLILIYFINKWNGEYYWIAFIIVFILLIWVDIILHKKLIKRIIHIIGCLVMMGMVLYIMLFTRYELQTKFYQPCWSPNGKQIAFFMEKALYQYTPSMFSFSSPDDIWKKYYICTMDNDGNNFKVVKKTDGYGAISWSGSGNIVFTQRSKVNNKPEAKMYKMRPEGNRLEEIWRWDDQSEWHGVGWLSPNEDYFMLYKSTGTTQVYAIYDREKKQIKRTLSYSDVNLDWFGSYKKNEIAVIVRQIDDKITERVLVKYDIDTDKIEYQDIIGRSYLEDLKKLDGFEYGFASLSYSPDRSMSADAGSLGSNDSTIFIYKRNNNSMPVAFTIYRESSYLFNIFGNEELKPL